jgi:hypothetical protein
MLNTAPSCSRTIPFPTKRATFSEVKRVIELLCRVELFPSLEALSAAQPLTREQVKKAAKVRKLPKTYSVEGLSTYTTANFVYTKNSFCQSQIPLAGQFL